MLFLFTFYKILKYKKGYEFMNKLNMYNIIDKCHNIVYTMYIRKGHQNMKTNIQKWGNSQGIRIPKVLLDTVNWSENEQIVITVDNGKLIIEKAQNRKNIKELFKNYKGDYEQVEMDWGDPVGEEIW